MNNAQSDAEKKAKALLQAGNFKQAVVEIQWILKSFPLSVQLHYMLVAANRYSNQLEQAIEQCHHLISLSPGYGRAYQELGHCFKAKGNKKEAYSNYLLAVKYNSALLASWKAIANLSPSENKKDIQRAQNAISHLEKMPVELQSVYSMINEGELLKAEKLCRHYLRRSPKHPEAMRLLASLGVQKSIVDEAEFILESCLEFHPDFMLARVDYANVLYKRQKYSQSYQQAKHLLDNDPHNAAIQMLYAEQCVALNQIDKAIEFYQKASVELGDNEVLWLLQGHAHKTIGDFDQAVTCYQKAYQVREDFGDAYWSLANLKTYQFSGEELAQMRRIADQKATPTVDKYHLNFALGKAFEDRKMFDESYCFYEQGNALKSSMSRYTQEENQGKVSRQIDTFKSAIVKDLSDTETNDINNINKRITPIFIVGLPRAGSTLIEQILSSHSEVEGTLELANIISMAHQLSRKKLQKDSKVCGYPAIVKALTPGELAALGKRYLTETAIHRTDKPYFIDKMPNNFFHIGLILSILPHAKIIDARRDPMSCCFSGYKQLFAEGQEFSYRLEDIGDYYLNYVKLMAHWQKIYPGKILQVNYESVVSDTENQVNRMLEYLELPFEKNCLTFYQTKRSVRTASAEQVRQPIYHSALEQWKNFEAHLSPLKTIVKDINGSPVD